VALLTSQRIFVKPSRYCNAREPVIV